MKVILVFTIPLLVGNLFQQFYSVIQTAKYYLRVVSIVFIPLATVILFANALQGMGHSFITMLTSALEFFARTSVALILTTYIGFTGVCLAGPARGQVQ